MHSTVLKGLALVFALVIAAILAAIVGLNDSHPGYELNLHIEPSMEQSTRPNHPFQAGFSAVDITPKVPDRWFDANDDAKYIAADGDSYDDVNGNGQFDAVWIAGFSNKRAANGVHDAIWARAAVFDDGQARIAIVSLDVVGLLHEEVLDIRQSLPSALGVDYLLITSTHTHEGPDTIGIWGESIFQSGVNEAYQRRVRSGVIEAVNNAVEAMRPASLHVSQDLEGAEGLVADSRQPEVFDLGLRTIRAVNNADQSTLGTLVVWANHPETVWSGNLLISSDFPHYVRRTVEQGIHNDQLVIDGVGGVAIYINGAIGGLMTTAPRHGIRHPFSEEIMHAPTFAKAEAQGISLGMLALRSMQNATSVEQPQISVRAKTVYLPLDNTKLTLAAVFGLVRKDFTGWNETRTEVAAIDIGPISIVAIPGEIYPELVNGGIVAPAGQDYDTAPLEIPPIREMMAGQFKFIFGLANDEIGYIIPKSEWDVKAPFLYHAKKSPYGETNSFGSDTALILHKALKELLQESETLSRQYDERQ